MEKIRISSRQWHKLKEIIEKEFDLTYVSKRWTLKHLGFTTKLVQSYTWRNVIDHEIQFSDEAHQTIFLLKYYELLGLDR